MTTEVRVILSTCPPDKAAGLAETLVTRSLAACVNVLPAVQSVYRWQGQVKREGEAMLVIKTSRARVESVKAALLEQHSYEVPEFAVLTVDSGHAAWLDWVVKSVS